MSICARRFKNNIRVQTGDNYFRLLKLVYVFKNDFFSPCLLKTFEAQGWVEKKECQPSILRDR